MSGDKGLLFTPCIMWRILFRVPLSLLFFGGFLVELSHLVLCFVLWLYFGIYHWATRGYIRVFVCNLLIPYRPSSPLRRFLGLVGKTDLVFLFRGFRKAQACGHYWFGYKTDVLFPIFLSVYPFSLSFFSFTTLRSFLSLFLACFALLPFLLGGRKGGLVVRHTFFSFFFYFLFHFIFIFILFFSFCKDTCGLVLLGAFSFAFFGVYKISFPLCLLSALLLGLLVMCLKGCLFCCKKKLGFRVSAGNMLGWAHRIGVWLL